MAKKFVIFNTQSGFDNGSDKYDDDSLVIIKETKKIITHGVIIEGVDFNIDDYFTKEEQKTFSDEIKQSINEVKGLIPTQFKTINNQTITGEGNLEITGGIQGVKTEGSVVSIGEDNEITYTETDSLKKEPSLVVGVGHKMSPTMNKYSTTIIGRYSQDNSNATIDKQLNPVFIIGCGNSDTERDNSVYITQDGKFYVKRPSGKSGMVLVGTVAEAYDNGTISKTWSGTQAEYDSITDKDDTTIYYITD